MYKAHLSKRTVIPKFRKEKEEKANSEVITYYLDMETLLHYRNLDSSAKNGERHGRFYKF